MRENLAFGVKVARGREHWHAITMGKTPSKSRKQLRSNAAPYVAKQIAEPVSVTVAPVPIPEPTPPPPAPLPPIGCHPSDPPDTIGCHPSDLPDTITPPAPPPYPPMLPTFDLRAIARTALGFAEAALTVLPAPSEIVAGDPTSPAPPPGRVPSGDSRSMRTEEQFALIYRHGASLVSRRGVIGQRGVWRVVDYPGPTQAAAAYAAECSRLRAQGFADVE